MRTAINFGRKNREPKFTPAHIEISSVETTDLLCSLWSPIPGTFNLKWIYLLLSGYSAWNLDWSGVKLLGGNKWHICLSFLSKGIYFWSENSEVNLAASSMTSHSRKDFPAWKTWRTQIFINEVAMGHSQYSTLNCAVFCISFKLKNNLVLGSSPLKHTLYFISLLRHNTLSSAVIFFWEEYQLLSRIKQQFYRIFQQRRKSLMSYCSGSILTIHIRPVHLTFARLSYEAYYWGIIAPIRNNKSKYVEWSIQM